MPKLNLVLMVVLTLAVIAGAGFLVLEPRTDARAEESARRAKLLRKLADNDPDLRRDAEAEFRRMGAAAAPLLQEAAKSKDATLAARAAALLKELQPPAAFALVLESAQGSFERGEPVRVRVKCPGLENVPGDFAFEITDPSGSVHQLVWDAEPLPVEVPLRIPADQPGSYQVRLVCAGYFHLVSNSLSLQLVD